MHKLHKVQNALVEMRNLLLGLRKLLFLLLGELCKLLFLLLFELCNVGVSPLHELNNCIKGSMFPCCAFVLRLSKDILQSFISK